MPSRFDFTSQKFFRDPAAGVQRLRAVGPVVATRFPIVGKLFCAGSPADIVERYARLLPLSVICELLGLPAAGPAEIHRLGAHRGAPCQYLRLSPHARRALAHEALSGSAAAARARARRR